MKKIVYILGCCALLGLTMSSCSRSGSACDQATDPNTNNYNAPEFDTMYLGSFVAYTDLTRDVWAYDSSINGYYTRVYQDDIAMTDFKDLQITATVNGKTYTIYKQGSTNKTKIAGCIVDWSVAYDEDGNIVGFDINWYDPAGSEPPLYPVNPSFNVVLILYHNGYKMSSPSNAPVKKTHFMVNMKMKSPRNAHSSASPYKTE